MKKFVVLVGLVMCVMLLLLVKPFYNYKGLTFTVEQDNSIVALAEQYQIDGLSVEATALEIEAVNFIDGNVYRGESITIPYKDYTFNYIIVGAVVLLIGGVVLRRKEV